MKFCKPTDEQRIAVLKRTAKSNLLAFRAETLHLDCGTKMACYINPRALEFANAYNAAMLSLKALDKSFPAGWSPIEV